MELHRIRCTQCGADFDRYDPSVRFMKCTRMGCGAVFVVEQGVNFASVQAQKAEEIGNLRHALENAVASRNNEMIYRYAADIQAILPDDFIANFWVTLLSVRLYDKHPNLYKAFLRSDRAVSPEDAEKCVEYVIEYAEDSFRRPIITFLDYHLPPEVAKQKKAELEGHLFRLRELHKKSADIFILCDDDGGEIADSLYDSLRSRNTDCWSERKNLSIDTTGYTARIREAVEKCRVMLIVHSASLGRNAFSKELISERVKCGIPLICVKTDDTPFTAAFKKLIGNIPIYNAADPDIHSIVFHAADDALNPGVPPNIIPSPKPKIDDPAVGPLTPKVDPNVLPDDPKPLPIEPAPHPVIVPDPDDPFVLPGINGAGSSHTLASDPAPLSPPPLTASPSSDSVRDMLFRDLEEVKRMPDLKKISGFKDEEDDFEPPMMLL